MNTELLYQAVEILVVFYGTAAIAFFARETGLYRWFATKWLSKKNSYHRLLLIIIGLAFLVNLTTDNDDVVLTIIPIIVASHFVRKASLLVTAFIAANTLSIIFLTSNPTNIIASSTFEISYPSFFTKMILPAAVISVAALLPMFFRKRLKKPSAPKLPPAKHPHMPVRSVVLLCATVAALASQNIHDVPTWMIVGFSGVIALFLSYLRGSLAHVLKQLPVFPAIIIMVGFGLIFLIDQTDWLSELAIQIASYERLAIGIGSFIFVLLASQIIVNIPATLLASLVLAEVVALRPDVADIGLLAIVIASNIAALISYRASLAGHLFIAFTKKQLPHAKRRWPLYFWPSAATSIVVSVVILSLY